MMLHQRRIGIYPDMLFSLLKHLLALKSSKFGVYIIQDQGANGFKVGDNGT